jgi:Ca2+-binding RTX toxin-like protein
LALINSQTAQTQLQQQIIDLMKEVADDQIDPAVQTRLDAIDPNPGVAGTINGGSGDDSTQGSTGVDTTQSSTGVDTTQSGSAADTTQGSSAADTTNSGAGTDTTGGSASTVSATGA